MSTSLTSPTTVASAYVALPAAWLYIGYLHHRIRRFRGDLAVARFDAAHDPLTGVYNRRPLHGALQTAIGSGRPFAVLLLDVDRFKTINDRYGHACGDAVLVELARRLSSADESITQVFRLGGDEFAALVSGDDDHGVAVGKHFWALAAGDEFVLPGGRRIPVHVSVGVASHRLGVDADTLLRHADTALARAKAGHTVYRFYPGAPAPATLPRPRRRQRDQYPAPTYTAAGSGTVSWRCWFDAAEITPLADHAVSTPHHQRSDAEDALIQDCPGGIAVVADGGYVTAFSTGFPQPLRDPHNPDTVLWAAAVDSDEPPILATLIAHLHFDADAVDAIRRAADRGGLLEVTVTGQDATFGNTYDSDVDLDAITVGHIQGPGTEPTNQRQYRHSPGNRHR